ncbi:MAG: L-2,4-diaminobutyrate decarboxylase [Verrucomicrobiota bacterium]
MSHATHSHALRPGFQAAIQRLRESSFSRDPARWPLFSQAPFADILAFRRLPIPPAERVAHYPDGPALLDQLRALDAVPHQPHHAPTALDPLILFSAALSKAWESPRSVENVATMPSDPALYGAVLGSLANPNLVHPEYAEMAVELEHAVIRQIATQTGWDPTTATGIFTQGGTFCNLYGYLLGIRKNLPLAREFGLEHGLDYRIINSQGGHYSNTTNLSLLGVNLRRKTIRIRITDDNDMDMADLERQLRACFQLGCVVPTIMLTMGTTDTFAVDQVKPVRDLCDRLCAQYEITAKPHLHVDAAVGWPLIFFLDYDFDRNPLEINDSTLIGLQRNTERFRQLRHADSFTVDFHKWGYVPYTSSLVMIRDRRDLDALEHDPENFSYFEKDTEGQTHLHSTIECSRGGAGIFAAATSLLHLGAEGHQLLVANSLQTAGYFRHRLAQTPGVMVLAPANHGPSASFRLYDPASVADPEAEFALEYDVLHTPDWHQRVTRNNCYHRDAFKRRGKGSLYTSYVQSAAHTDYDQYDRYRTLPGEKAVFMNPLTHFTDIDAFVASIHG